MPTSEEYEVAENRARVAVSGLLAGILSTALVAVGGAWLYQKMLEESDK